MDEKQAEKQRKLDEACTVIVDHFPRTWHSLYCRLVEEGFEPEQAFSLLKCFVMRDAMYGVHLHKD